MIETKVDLFNCLYSTYEFNKSSKLILLRIQISYVVAEFASHIFLIVIRTRDKFCHTFLLWLMNKIVAHLVYS